MKLLRVIRTEIRSKPWEGELWLLVTPNLDGVEIPGTYTVMVDGSKLNSLEGHPTANFWLPLRKVDHYDELPEPTTALEWIEQGMPM